MITSRWADSRVRRRTSRFTPGILYIRERLNRSHHTGQPLDVIARDTDRDRFMSAAEAAEYGLIDQVLERRPSAE